MNVEIEKAASKEEEMALIKVCEMTDDIQSAVDILHNDCRTIPVMQGTETLLCGTEKIYYLESVDKHTYVYTKDCCYETRYRLYELEDMLHIQCLRCSKAMIVNIRKIKSVKAELNGRMIAELLNGEQIIISRAYVKELKRKLGI